MRTGRRRGGPSCRFQVPGCNFPEVATRLRVPGFGFGFSALGDGARHLCGLVASEKGQHVVARLALVGRDQLAVLVYAAREKLPHLCSVYSLGFTVYGLWVMVEILRFVIYGLWFMVYVLCYIFYFYVRINSSR